MSDKEDQIDSLAGIGLNDLVFNEKNQERRSWKFCNSRLPRSEVVYFTQIVLILSYWCVLDQICVFFILIVKSQHFGFHCFHAQLATRFLIRSYEQDNFLTSDRLFTAVCGPSCCGKTELKFQMLLRNTFYPNFKSIYYFYQHEQPKFSSLERNLNIFSQSFLDLISFHSWKTVCLFSKILARKFSMTKKVF